MSDATPIRSDIIAAQSTTVEPEAFQSTLIESMTAALLREPSPPCLLRAPTGSGKTFVMSRVLANVSAERDVMWFWFVPFSNLVQQTEDQLSANCSGELIAGMLVNTRNQEPAPSVVLLSTAQAVAKAQDRNKGYDANKDDTTRSIASLVARARVRGLAIGLVVDEAHIGLDSATEFGRFAKWLKPEYFIAATATPKDQRLNDFVAQAGLSAVEAFTASRADVVEARLNKRYIEAIVYQSSTGIQSVTDSKRTVLRQAWKRNVTLRRMLAAEGINLEPLLLVQVGNGDEAIDEARRDLMELCKVPLDAIGIHSSAEPDPVMMASIANDSSKKVLVFKQSAGTGFDAPRAFVLASTKPVNDSDFATQFIGRVMRVLPQLRARFPKPQPIPEDLDTAYVFLANADAQEGFSQAVAVSASIKSELGGQTIKLAVRETFQGGYAITNRTTAQTQVMYDAPLPTTVLEYGSGATRVETRNPRSEASAVVEPVVAPGTQASLIPPPLSGEDDVELDQVKPDGMMGLVKRVVAPTTSDALVEMLVGSGLRVYRKRRDIPTLPRVLMREDRPRMTNMAAISKAVASRLDLPEAVRNVAINVALNRAKGTEIITELTGGTITESEIAIVTDRGHLAAEAWAVLRALPQVEEADHRIILETIAQRFATELREKLSDSNDDEFPSEKLVKQSARDAAFWAVLKQEDLLKEALFAEISTQSTLVESGPLPDAMLFPDDFTLDHSRKNIYGVLPPNAEQTKAADGSLFVDDLRWFSDRVHKLSNGGEFITSPYDGSSDMNEFEREFARALDNAPFVRWWHRNADRKPYKVSIVRAEHSNYFYPDFVVCLEHSEADVDQPLQRLIETKDNTKDAARKMRHTPKHYGNVLFVTQDGKRIKVINSDGSLGATVDTDDLVTVQDWLRKTRPTV